MFRLRFKWSLYVKAHLSSVLANGFVFLVDEAAMYAYGAIMNNHGQNCCAGSRTYVHESIYDEFVAKAKALAEVRVVGDPFDADTAQGPQVHVWNDKNVLAIILYILYTEM